MFRVGDLPARARRCCTGLLGALALAGCAANCLRDSDCDDAHVCRRDRCELPGSSASDSGPGNAGEAGGAALGPSTLNGGAAGSASGAAGSASGAGGSVSEVGGSASGAGGSASGAAGSASEAGGSASVTDTSSGGSATGGRENLDASGG